jgi:hypothetical protein
MGGGDMLTSRAAKSFHPVFNHPQAHFWQLVDLSALFDLPCDLSQLAAARFAVHWPMRDDLIGLLPLLQRMSEVPWLPSRRLPFLLRFQLAFQAIARRWLATVVAIFRQTPFQLVIAQQCPHQQPFQFLDSSIFLSDLFFEVSKRLFEVGQLLFQLCGFFGHTLSLSALSSPLKGDLSNYTFSIL